LSSGLWFLAALVLLWFLVRRLFPEHAGIQLYAVLAFGFIPQIFNVSRIAFEVISELPVMLGVLWCARSALEMPPSRRQQGMSAMTGVCLALVYYAYTTNRAFMLLMLGSLILCYGVRRHWKSGLVMALSAGVLLIPVVVFQHAHPGALTKRFVQISYLGRSDVSPAQAVGLFLQRYFQHVGPDFLLLHGDHDLRHMTGSTGALFWSVAVLLVIGLVALVRSGELRRSPFARWLVVLLFLAPVPSALTTGESAHALRSLPFALFAVVISCYGVAALSRLALPKREWIVAACVVSVSIEATMFVVDYFHRYPQASVPSFMSAGFADRLKAAVAQRPAEIVVSEGKFPAAYTLLEFYRRVLPLESPPPMRAGSLEVTPGSCLIYFSRAPTIPPNVEVTLHIREPNDWANLLCTRQSTRQGMASP
jgi:hypothetical protein